MRRLRTIITIFALTAAFSMVPGTATAEAAETRQPTTTVSVSQRILPPPCYDTVNVTEGTADYITVYECEYQRPPGR